MSLVELNNQFDGYAWELVTAGSYLLIALSDLVVFNSIRFCFALPKVIWDDVNETINLASKNMSKLNDADDELTLFYLF